MYKRQNWYKVNPSLGYTVDIERLRDAYREAKQNPADEITFKWLRMNMWVSSTTAWIPDRIYMRGNEEIDMRALELSLIHISHDRDNLIALCKSCHSKIHAQQGDRWSNDKTYSY